MRAAIDDDCIERLLLFCGHVGGALAAVGLGAAFGPEAGPGSLWLLVGLYAVGFSAVATCMEVLAASAAALFVCFARRPAALSQSYPIIYHRLVRLGELRHYHSNDEL